MDLLSEAQAARTRELVQAAAPWARVHCCSHGKMPLQVRPPHPPHPPHPLQGNFDPSLLVEGTPATVTAAVDSMLDEMGSQVRRK